jgi:DNA phosphorothioation-associated putative methyltransferase
MRDDLAGLRLGKRFPSALYLHRDYSCCLPEDLQALVARAKAEVPLQDTDYGVVKISSSGERVSLLAYPGFFEEGFPILQQSWSLVAGEPGVQHRDYRRHWNPPVLHRKELLLALEHPRYAEFAALSAAAEAAGLFDDPSAIGLLLPWRETLRARGLRAVGNRLLSLDGIVADSEPEILRYRTALRRTGLSTPLQALLRHGFLDGSNTLFDYGCGRGDDLSALEELGVPSSGWDPYFNPDAPRVDADLVNLGFVLNVIEDLDERREALLSAFALARKLLVVAVLVGGRTAYERYRLFRDGVLTARGTFQKYFTQQELASYLEQHLAREPIAIGPGCFFVFKDDRAEQQFLASRQTDAPMRSLPLLRRRSSLTPTPRPSKRSQPTRWEAAKPTLDDFFSFACTLGREPASEEWPRIAELKGLGAPKRILEKLLQERGETEFLQARRRRIDDLLVYLALTLFERRRSAGSLPPNIQRDIREFWGSHRTALEAGKALLYSLGEPQTRVVASRLAAREGLGYLAEDDAFYFHPSVTNRLPKELRVFVGCATRLFGEVEEGDLVKVHSRTGKLSVLTYEGFDDSPLPLLVDRVKIDLRRQDLLFVDHSNRPEGRQVLYFKSRYLPSDFPNYEAQKRFDLVLQGAQFLDFTGYGPTLETLLDQLHRRGWKINGLVLEPPHEQPADTQPPIDKSGTS